MPKPNDKFTVAQLKQYIRDHKELNIRLGQNKPQLIADLKKTGNWEGSSPVKKAPVKKAPVKKASSKKITSDEKYMKMVDDNNENHPFGDTIQQVIIKGEKYDWNGIDLMDGFGRKVGELKNEALLKKWNRGATNKFTPPKVSSGVKMMSNVPKKFDEGKRKKDKFEKQRKEDEERDKQLAIKVKPIVEKITKITKSAKYRSKKSFDEYLSKKLTRGNDEISEILWSWFYGANNWVDMKGLKEAKTKFLDVVKVIPNRDEADVYLTEILKRLES